MKGTTAVSRMSLNATNNKRHLKARIKTSTALFVFYKYST
jgi:hypothetical protein